MENSPEFIGAIAGNTDGVIQGNYFVHDELAAVNGISYAGKAEPFPTKNFYWLKTYLQSFKTFCLTFVDDDKEIEAIPFKYGETISADKIPGMFLRRWIFW